MSDEKTRNSVWSDDAWKQHLDSLNAEGEKKEEETPETPPEAPAPETPPVEPEKPEGDTPAAETPETPETPAAPETPAEAPVPTTLEIKFRGAPRVFDLKNPDELKEVRDALSKGLNYEALLKEDDERIEKAGLKARDAYFQQSGIVAIDPATQTFKPSPHGIVRWALTHLGAENFQKAVTDVLGTQSPSPSGGAGGLSMAEIDALIKEAESDPNDPVFKGQLALAKALKASALEQQSLKNGLDTRFKSFEDRFKGMDTAAQASARAEYARAMYAHRDAEIAKVPNLAMDDDDKADLMARATRLENAAVQQGRQWSPELSKECITAAVKALAGKRVASATQQAQTEHKAKIEARPTAKSPPPPASAPKPAPSTPKKPISREERSKAWDQQWKEEMVERAR